MKKLLILSILSILLLSISIYTHSTKHAAVSPQTTHVKQLSNIKTYTYKITKIDSSGYYGTSTKDQTGIYFVNENIPKGTELKEGDTIKVSFPNNSYEKITNIEKLSYNPN
jgi:hypothetical protein